MRKSLFVTICAVAVTSCGPVSVYYKEEASAAQLKSDLLSCQVDALEKAPVANQIRQRAPRYIPGTRYCSSSGDCYTRGGFFVEGEIYTVDVNAKLRKDLETQCMAKAGYRPVELRRCRSSTTQTAVQGTADRLPPLSEKSCASRDAAGDWQIIDPAP